MRMFLVQHYEGGEWVNSYREDLTTYPDVPLALFYTMGEADAYVTVMRGLIHTGGADVRFRLMNVVVGEPVTSVESQTYIDTGEYPVRIIDEVVR